MQTAAARAEPHTDQASFTQADVQAHPLFVLVRNAMIESALTGIVPPEVIAEQLTPVPRDLLQRYTSSPHSAELDEAMLKLLRLQQSFIQEHKDVNRLCEDATSASFQAISRLAGTDEVAGVVPSPGGQDPVSTRMPPVRQGVPLLISPSTGHYFPPKQDGGRGVGAKRPLSSFQYFPHNGELTVPQSGGDGPALKRKKSSGLDRSGSDILRSWIIRNWKHPYPSESTKTNLVMATGFTRVQVNNWFINARRRLIKKHSAEELERMAQDLEEREAAEDTNSTSEHDPRQGTVTPSAVFRNSDSDEESSLSPTNMQPWYGPQQRPRRDRDHEKGDYPPTHMYPRVALELPNILSFPSASTTSWGPPPLPLMSGTLGHHDGDPALPTRLPVPEVLLARREKDPM